MKNVIDGVVSIIVHACMGKESEHIQNERGRLCEQHMCRCIHAIL